jgi:hypothetical protein
MKNEVAAVWPPVESGAIDYRKATDTDCIQLFPKLREQDRNELFLSSGINTAEILIKSVGASEESWLATGANGVPLGVFGVVRHGDLGAVWLVATPDAASHAVELVGQGREWTRSLLSRYARVFNCVHSENATAIAWLSSLGFTIGEVIPDFGVAKVPFTFFYQDGCKYCDLCSAVSGSFTPVRCSSVSL